MEEEILKKEYEWAWKSLKETIASLEEYKNENRWDDYIKVVEEKEKLLTDNISQPLKQKIELLKIEKNQTWKNVLSRIFTLGFYNRKKQISKKIDKLEEAIFTVNEKWRNEVDIINSMKNRLENEFKSENNRLKSDNEKMNVRIYKQKMKKTKPNLMS
ncbi:hypothetical protein [Spiroplasma sp. AdecLV25b]|uniref:hypothetical protein n=1 Tax=Spiroplasma sp. AdecLV25b TaxID=3027162 RepID=UPI0027DF68F7|nr:hypothetical protein [Spiroplasma sp. AdecLV25b]